MRSETASKRYQIFLIVSMIVTILSIVPSVFCEYLLEKVCARVPSFSQREISDSKYLMNAGELRRNTSANLMSYFANRSKMDVIGSAKDTPFVDEMTRTRVPPLSAEELRLQEMYSYMDLCILEEEVNQLFDSAKNSIEYNLATRAMPWDVSALNTDDGVHRAEALKNIIGIYDDGSPVSLTLFQRFFFGTARKRLEWKMKKVRNQVDSMMEDIDVFMRSDQGCVDHINSYLIQSFILEQLSPFRRYAIKNEFFQFDNANPAPVNGAVWMCCWIFFVLLWIFLIYWCLLWAVQNSRVTAMSWTLQVIFVLMQEFFVNENVQILIMNVIVVEAMRSQVKRITDVLTTILISKVNNTDDLTTGKNQPDGFNVAQHMTASCRVARKAILHNLVASKILMQLNDHDIAVCREVRQTRIGFWTKMLITIPTLLALSHETVQECFLDILIPTVWCCFVLSNALLWGLSPLAMVAPYVVILAFLVCRYCYIIPKRRRRQQYRQAVLQQHKFSRDSPAKYEDNQDSEENMWRNMNLSLSLVCKDNDLSSMDSASLSTSSLQTSGVAHHPKFSFVEAPARPINIPDEITEHMVKLSKRDKHLYNKNKKGRKKYQRVMNKHLWKVKPKLPKMRKIKSTPDQDERNVASKKLYDEWSLLFYKLGSNAFEPDEQSHLSSEATTPQSSTPQSTVQSPKSFTRNLKPARSLERMLSTESLQSYKSMRSIDKMGVTFEEPSRPSLRHAAKKQTSPMEEPLKPARTAASDRSMLLATRESLSPTQALAVIRPGGTTATVTARMQSQLSAPSPSAFTANMKVKSKNVDTRLKLLSSRYITKKVNCTIRGEEMTVDSERKSGKNVRNMSKDDAPSTKVKDSSVDVYEEIDNEEQV